MNNLLKALQDTIFLIGPGGVGKSTVGKILAKRLKRKFIDLDLVFMDKIDHIGELIAREGYEKYCALNSQLASNLLSNQSEPVVFICSSGFLTYSAELVRQNLSLFEDGISILLLPDEDIDISTRVVVDRQLKRGFGLKRKGEEKKFRQRFSLYSNYGDIKIYSHERPYAITEQIIAKLEIVSNKT